jgi:hypothetical protein
MQHDCKTSFKTEELSGNPVESSTEQTREVFEDVRPSGIDSEGNEVSFESYLGSQPVKELEPGWSRTGLRRRADWNYHAEDYWTWYESKVPNGRKRPPPDPVMGCPSGEHIAGPNCEDTQGYKGHSISLEEMRTCSAVQCLMEKKSQTRDWLSDWNPESDDEDFEAESDYFLSGLAHKCCSWEDDTNLAPERHDVGQMDPSLDGDGFSMGDMSFHPCCLEIYRRVSQWRVGAVDVPGLAEWWDQGHETSATPEHAAIRRGTGQWWQHHMGDEFLAANPLQIPALDSLFKAADRSQKDYNARASPFDAQMTTPSHSQIHDLFGKLPEELRDMVLAPLSSADIANLRLASRSFRHLPFTLWHDLIKKEMPWIWEAWTDCPYPFLACTTKPELEADTAGLWDRTMAMRDHGSEEQADSGGEQEGSPGGEEETSPESEEDATPRGEYETSPETGAAQWDTDEMWQPRAVRQLPRLQTDWYFLYCQLTREWKNIKGLQNRERIWKTLEFIVHRVENPDEDLGVVVREHKESFPFYNERIGEVKSYEDSYAG